MEGPLPPFSAALPRRQTPPSLALVPGAFCDGSVRRMARFRDLAEGITQGFAPVAWSLGDQAPAAVRRSESWQLLRDFTPPVTAADISAQPRRVTKLGPRTSFSVSYLAVAVDLPWQTRCRIYNLW
jgi:hypothetical protein